MISRAAKKLLWSFILTIQVVSYGSYTILVHLCEENGQIQFSSTSMNLLIEFIKLKISVFAYAIRKYMQAKRKENDIELGSENLSPLVKHTSSSPSSSLLPKNLVKSSLDFSVPAFLYFVNNNLAVYIQLYMDSTSYQMLSNLKIFTTACLYYFFLGRKAMTPTKVLSLFILFVAGLIYSVANLKSLSNYYLDELDLQSLFSSFDMKDVTSHVSSKQDIKFYLRDQIYITEMGFVMICIYCILSGVSGVYNEYLLKRNFSECIYLQNAYLYFYGCLFNLVAYYFETSLVSRGGVKTKQVATSSSGSLFFGLFNGQFFAGFSVFTWAIVATQVLNGFLMSVVMKHSSNITRLFVISCSLVVTTVLSVLVFSLKLNGYFYYCFCLIMLSLYLYVR